MTYASSIIALAAAWAAITGNFSLVNLGLGLLLAFLLMVVSRHRSPFVAKAWTLLKFVAVFFGELVLANLRVARDVLSPRPLSHRALWGSH
jgi:multicomponent Na+:H+ antiporter subunit E